MIDAKNTLENPIADRLVIDYYLQQFQEQFCILFLSIIGAMALILMVGRSLFEMGSLTSRSTRHIAAKNLS